jgi:hypothetical protein
MYRRLIIYYLSGTGNALVARWFADLHERHDGGDHLTDG